MPNKIQPVSLIKPASLIAAVGISAALLGAILVRTPDATITNATEIAWLSPEGPPLTLTPVLGRLSSELTATGLFGYPDEAISPNDVTLDANIQPADPRLPALLLLGQTDQDRVAIARLEDGNITAYGIGDTLESGWVIADITAATIEIERNGIRDIVRLRAELPSGG